MGTKLPALARELLDRRAFAVITTINPDGSPQSSVIWAGHDGEGILFSTIRGRRKTRNLERDPRAAFLAYDPADPYRYVEVRGTVTLTEEGGDELIDELCRAYAGRSWPHRPEEVRVVCRLTATHVVTAERGHPQR
jgi:PPOX class probable F420-dependent enzyme